jgi:hypothetical protein
MLQAAWKSGGAPEPESASGFQKLEKGEVRSFRITKLDAKDRSIEVTLA